MTTLEARLLERLLHLEEAVRSMPAAATKPDLLAIFRQIDELTGQLPSRTDPALLHYLHKKSYQKARFWLEGLDAENQSGPCGHTP